MVLSCSILISKNKALQSANTNLISRNEELLINIADIEKEKLDITAQQIDALSINQEMTERVIELEKLSRQFTIYVPKNKISSDYPIAQVKGNVYTQPYNDTKILLNINEDCFYITSVLNDVDEIWYVIEGNSIDNEGFYGYIEESSLEGIIEIPDFEIDFSNFN